MLRGHDQKAFGDDVSARRKMVVATLQTGKTTTGVEPGRDTLITFGSVPMVREGKTLFAVDTGINLGKDFVERIKQRFGVNIAVHAFDGKDFANLSSTFTERSVATPEQLKV